ncbi:MAG: release factor glutamine methyltransferase [Pyrinomonadaceae bacterium]|jgi:release factor glutamine methyltransferase|nr:release factor glutamine methyltransferase [Pyrinomonadaceae bacterium]
MCGVLYSTTEMSEQPHSNNSSSSHSRVKIAEALTEAAATLRAAGVADARPDARALLSHTLARGHAFLVAHSDDELEPHALALFRERVTRRAAGEPVQYITGRQEFYGLDFEVNPAVLIPRPETELLVACALELLRGTDAPLVCDVGTGSGCIPVALLHERTDAHAFGLDISTDALAVAARNAARHHVNPRLTLLVSDCFYALDVVNVPDAVTAATTFDLITSNPPYIAESEIENLQREVREHEPRGALTPGGDGLSIIRRLVAEAPRFIRAGGHLIFEIGYDQHEAVARLVHPNVWTLLDIRRDLQGIPRVVVLQHRAG